MDGRACGTRGKEWGAGASPVAQSCAISCLSQISAFCALATRSPCICSRLRVALRFAQQPTGLTLPCGARMVSLPHFGSLWAFGPSAHRAHASLRACRGLGQTPGRSIVAEGAGRAHRSFRSLANIGVLCAGRAQPLYLLTPSGRFGPLAQVPTGHTLPFGAPPGRFGPLAQQPTGLTLPSGAPKTCAAAQKESVASARRAQETRHAPLSQKSHERPSTPSKKLPAPAQAGTGGHKARRINQANGFSVGYGSDAGRL